MSQASLRAHLLNIHRSQWRDQVRRSWRTVPLDAAPDPPVAAAADAIVDLRWTERQLAQIAAGDREALLLHARDGLSYEEVGRALGVSVGAVKSRIFRARQALAALRD